MTASQDALRLGAQGFAELAVNNWLTTIPLHYSYSAILARDPSTALGVLIWSDNASANELWVQLAYVLPSYRRLGTHKTMFDALKDKARELKRDFIGSGIHIDNKPMRMAAKNEEREIIGVLTRYKVE